MMTESRHGKEGKGASGAAKGLAAIEEALANSPSARPVESWNPPHRGDSHMRIAADGQWFHEGAVIRRDALVRLFASVLRREADGGFVLVTPVEKLSIAVDDAPFIAVDMDIAGEGRDQVLGFRTNVGDYVRAGVDHPLRLAQGDDGGFKPYVTVRSGLEALATRAVAVDVADLIGPGPGGDGLGLYSDGAFFAVDGGA